MNKNILSKFTALLMLTTSVVMGGNPALDDDAAPKAQNNETSNKYLRICFSLQRGGGFSKTLDVRISPNHPKRTLYKTAELILEDMIIRGSVPLSLCSEVTLVNVTEEDVKAVWAKVREQDPSYVLPGENLNNFSKLPLGLAGFLGGLPRSKESPIMYILGVTVNSFDILEREITCMKRGLGSRVVITLNTLYFDKSREKSSFSIKVREKPSGELQADSDKVREKPSGELQADSDKVREKPSGELQADSEDSE